jgi:hypothetical protein
VAAEYEIRSFSHRLFGDNSRNNGLIDSHSTLLAKHAAFSFGEALS